MRGGWRRWWAVLTETTVSVVLAVTAAGAAPETAPATLPGVRLRLTGSLTPAFAPTAEVRPDSCLAQAGWQPRLPSDQWQAAWGTLDSSFTADPAQPGRYHWRLVITPRQGVTVDQLEARLEFVDAAGQAQAGYPVVHYVGRGWSAPIAYISEGRHLHGSLLAFADLTPLNSYLQRVEADPVNVVSVTQEGLQFHIPGGTLVAAEGESFVLLDAWLQWRPAGNEGQDSVARQQGDDDAAQQMVMELATLYPLLHRPDAARIEPGVHNEVGPGSPGAESPWWQEALSRLIPFLMNDPRNWTTDGRFLQAYVGDRRNDAELITQLGVAVPLGALLQQGQLRDPLAQALYQRLTSHLEDFYDPALGVGGSVTNNLAPAARTWDTWYYLYPNIQLAALALQGDPQAVALAKRVEPTLLALGKGYGYRFPRGMDVTTPGSPGDGTYEWDATGAFVYLMLQHYQLTGEPQFLAVARAAADQIRGKGFEYEYEAHMTAIGAAGLAWLYQLTGDRTYLDLSYVPLANLLVNSWWWESDYGYSRFYPTFLSVQPTPGNELIAAFESGLVWRYLTEFRERAGDALPALVNQFLDVYLAHNRDNLRFSLPAQLPGVAVASRSELGEIVPDAPVPLEDLPPGWRQAGRIGQELYGAGVVLELAVPRSPAGAAGLLLSTDAVVQARVGSDKVTETLCAAVVGVAPQGRMVVPASGRFSIPVYLENRGDEPLDLQVAAEVLPSGWQVEPAQVQLRPGEGRSVLFTVTTTTDRTTSAAGWVVPFYMVLRQHPVGVAAGSTAAGEADGWTLVAAAAEFTSGQPVAAGREWLRLQWESYPPAGGGAARLVAPAEAVGGSARPQSATTGLRIWHSSGGWGGVWSQPVLIDPNRTPWLVVDVAAVDGAWALKLVREGGDVNGVYLQGDTRMTGLFRYDLRSVLGVGWQRVRLVVLHVGAGEGVQLRSVQALGQKGAGNEGAEDDADGFGKPNG